MASSVTIVNGSGAVWGIPNNELGVNMEEFSGDVEPEFIETLKGINNCARSDAYGSNMLDLKMSGEILSTNTVNSVMLAVLGTAFIPVNGTNFFAAPTTGLYLQKASYVYNRSGWFKFTANFKAKAGIP